MAAKMSSATVKKTTKAKAMKPGPTAAMKAKKITTLKALKAAPKAMKAMKVATAKKGPMKAAKHGANTAGMKSTKAVMRRATKAKGFANKSRAPAAKVPKALKELKAFVVNLERRPDRWARVSRMLRKETPWLDFEQFKASDGSKNPIPAEEVSETWSTERNLRFGDYFMWVHDEPGAERNGRMWKYVEDAPGEDDEDWEFTEDSDPGFWFCRDAPTFSSDTPRRATAKNKKSGETLRLKLHLQEKPDLLRMSGGERGCAHSHRRIWQVAAERPEPTLALEDDVHLSFDRSSRKGKSNGKNFTARLALALKHAPSDFDVIYLGWSGWRGGHHYRWKADYPEDAEAKTVIRKAEYVWTTVAYVISQAGAKKLLEAAQPLNQPVDNFMAWEASQNRLNSYVCLDEGEKDELWSGGIVDQFNFQGDTDIGKSDGGIQGDDVRDFLVA